MEGVTLDVKWSATRLAGLLCFLWFLSVDAVAFRPPSVPLVVHDPYFSIWSPYDNLHDGWPTHWSGATQALTSLVRIDGTTYQVMGQATGGTPVLPQISLDVRATQTIYQFQGHGVHLTMTFTTPLLPHRPDLLALPITFLNWKAKSLDAKPHNISLYYDNTAELCTRSSLQEVTWGRSSSVAADVMWLGTTRQDVLGHKGDFITIDWGYAYAATHRKGGHHSVLGDVETARAQFKSNGTIPHVDDGHKPQPAWDRWPGVVFATDLSVDAGVDGTFVVVLAYDDVYSVEYFGQRLRAWWHSHYENADQLVDFALEKHADIMVECDAWDKTVDALLLKAGGSAYRTLALLAYRQTLGAMKLTEDASGTVRYFLKEISSNGDMSTVDVMYPACPLLLLFSPRLLQLQLLPIFEFAANETSNPYTKPYAPHHLGTYPIADATTASQEDMPVEESANMLIMAAAVCVVEASTEWVAPQHWTLLTQWAQYLNSTTLTPGDQLCTDDFMGKMVNNSNLALKGILGMAAYGVMCDLRGEKALAEEYMEQARVYARQWIVFAQGDAANFALQYSKPHTWSLKYNLVWQRFFQIDIFPEEVSDKELKFYQSVEEPYGVPLDSRAKFAKLDWLSWVASIDNDPALFEHYMQTLYQYANDTPSRVPLSDWYYTVTGKRRGFRARPVVGALYMPALLLARAAA